METFGNISCIEWLVTLIVTYTDLHWLKNFLFEVKVFDVNSYINAKTLATFPPSSGLTKRSFSSWLKQLSCLFIYSWSKLA